MGIGIGEEPPAELEPRLEAEQLRAHLVSIEVEGLVLLFLLFFLLVAFLLFGLLLLLFFLFFRFRGQLFEGWGEGLLDGALLGVPPALERGGVVDDRIALRLHVDQHQLRSGATGFDPSDDRTGQPLPADRSLDQLEQLRAHSLIDDGEAHLAARQAALREPLSETPLLLDLDALGDEIHDDASEGASLRTFDSDRDGGRFVSRQRLGSQQDQDAEADERRRQTTKPEAHEFEHDGEPSPDCSPRRLAR